MLSGELLKIDELASLIEDAAQQPSPLIEAWTALDAVWQKTSIVGEQLSCLILRDWLEFMTNADLDQVGVLDLPDWSIDALLRLEERLESAWPHRALFEALERANAIELERSARALETRTLSFEPLARHLVALLASRKMTELALRVASRITQPFFFIAAAESIVEVCDERERAILADMAWVRSRDCRLFDPFGPGYTLSLWLDSIALRSIDDPARRAQLGWLEDRIRACSPTELQPSQDYDDIRYTLARRWIELGEVQRGMEWIAAIEDESSYWKANLATALPVALQAEFVLELVDSELDHLERGQPDQVSHGVIDRAAAASSTVADAVAQRLAQRLAQWAPEYSQTIVELQLAVLPHLSPGSAETTLKNVIDWFDREAREGTREELDDVLNVVLMTVRERQRDGLVVPENSNVAMAWAQRWPRRGALDSAEAPAEKESPFEEPAVGLARARREYRGLDLPALLGAAARSLPEAKRAALEHWANEHSIDLGVDRTSPAAPTEAPDPPPNLEPHTWRSTAHQRDAVAYWVEQLRWETASAGSAKSVAALEATVYSISCHRIFPELDDLFRAFQWISSECLLALWQRSARWSVGPGHRVGASDIALAIWVEGESVLDVLLR